MSSCTSGASPESAPVCSWPPDVASLQPVPGVRSLTCFFESGDAKHDAGQPGGREIGRLLAHRDCAPALTAVEDL
jgi:hypothetical protein